jgi:hypothetical protein
MKTRLLSSIALLVAMAFPAAGQTPSTTAAGGAAECPDESGWDAATWPVLVGDNGRHFIRVLHLYADASGESHGRESLMPTDVTPAPGGDGHPYNKVPNIALSIGFVGDVPAGFDNAPHTTPTRRLISFPYGEVCITTSDGKSWHMWPNRLLLSEDTVGKGHATKTLNKRPAIFLHSVFAEGADVPLTQSAR